MTEPTAEQIEAERERARAFLRDAFSWEESYFTKFWGCDAVTKFATALARVRIEARAAGRDEALEAALGVAEEFDNDGRFSAWEAAIQICNAIRALRGRT